MSDEVNMTQTKILIEIWRHMLRTNGFDGLEEQWIAVNAIEQAKTDPLFSFVEGELRVAWPGTSALTPVNSVSDTKLALFYIISNRGVNVNLGMTINLSDNL